MRTWRRLLAWLRRRPVDDPGVDSGVDSGARAIGSPVTVSVAAGRHGAEAVITRRRGVSLVKQRGPAVASAARIDKARSAPTLTTRVFEPLGYVRPVADDPTRLQKNFAEPVHGAVEDLRDIVDRAVRVAGSIPPAITAAWPERALTSVYGLTGYVMTAPDPTLDPWTDASPRGLPDDDRAGLLRLVALLLAAMHREGMAHGNVVPASFAIGCDPLRVRAVDLDHVRAAGAMPFTRRTTALHDDRPGRSVLLRETATYEGDRVAFATMVESVLAPTSAPGTRQSSWVERPAVRHLLTRAGRRPGSSPTMFEWTRALSP